MTLYRITENPGVIISAPMRCILFGTPRFKGCKVEYLKTITAVLEWNGLRYNTRVSPRAFFHIASKRMGGNIK